MIDLSIVRFSLKFQRIVQDEQEANFISRLHAGKLNIIPWYGLAILNGLRHS